MGRLIKELYSGEIAERVTEMPKSFNYILKHGAAMEEIEYWQKRMSKKEFKNFQKNIFLMNYKKSQIVIKSAFVIFVIFVFNKN